jgi:hypothetical protein
MPLLDLPQLLSVQVATYPSDGISGYIQRCDIGRNSNCYQQQQQEEKGSTFSSEDERHQSAMTGMNATTTSPSSSSSLTTTFDGNLLSGG